MSDSALNSTDSKILREALVEELRDQATQLAARMGNDSGDRFARVLEELEIGVREKNSADRLAYYKAFFDDLVKDGAGQNLLTLLSQYWAVRQHVINIANDTAHFNELKAQEAAPSVGPWTAKIAQGEREFAEGVDAAIAEAKEKGVPFDDVKKYIQNTVLEPTLTAHPTEPNSSEGIAVLDRFTDTLDAYRGGLGAYGNVQAGLAELLQTNFVPARKLTVREEVERSMNYAGRLYDSFPQMRDKLLTALHTHYGAEAEGVDEGTLFAGLMQPRSWAGADADGNTNVTAEEMRVAVAIHNREISLKHAAFIEANLAHGSAEFKTLAEELRTHAARVNEAIAEYDKVAGRDENASFAALTALEEVVQDPDLSAARLTQRVTDIVVEGDLSERKKEFQGLLQNFGMHYTRMDIRQNSNKHLDAMDPIIRGVTRRWMEYKGIVGAQKVYKDLNEDNRVTMLNELLSEPDKFIILSNGGIVEHGNTRLYIRVDAHDASGDPLVYDVRDPRPGGTPPWNTRHLSEVKGPDDMQFNLFEIIKHRHLSVLEKAYGEEDPNTRGELKRAVYAAQHPEIFQNFIISNTERASDVLEARFLAAIGAADGKKEGNPLSKPAGNFMPDIVPLLETKQDIESARNIFGVLMREGSAYKQYVEAKGNKQTVMVGYSDSERVSGIGVLPVIDEALGVLFTEMHGLGVTPKFFHGNGLDISRGGPMKVFGNQTMQGNAMRFYLQRPEMALHFSERQFWQEFSNQVNVLKEVNGGRVFHPSYAAVNADQYNLLTTVVDRSTRAFEELFSTAGRLPKHDIPVVRASGDGGSKAGSRAVGDEQEQAQYRGFDNVIEAFLARLTPYWAVKLFNVSSRATVRGGEHRKGHPLATFMEAGERPEDLNKVPKDKLRAISQVQSLELSFTYLDAWYGLGHALMEPISMPEMGALFKENIIFKEMVAKALEGLAHADFSMAWQYVPESHRPESPEALKRMAANWEGAQRTPETLLAHVDWEHEQCLERLSGVLKAAYPEKFRGESWKTSENQALNLIGVLWPDLKEQVEAKLASIEPQRYLLAHLTREMAHPVPGDITQWKPLGEILDGMEKRHGNLFGKVVRSVDSVMQLVGNIFVGNTEMRRPEMAGPMLGIGIDQQRGAGIVG